MSENKPKYRQIGKVLLNKEGGKFLALGVNQEKNQQYNCTVDIRVKDENGKVIYTGSNPILNVLEPSDDVKSKFPSLVMNLSVKLNNEQQ